MTFQYYPEFGLENVLTGEMFVTRSHSDILDNMADNCEYVAHFPKLEDLCVQFIRVNVKYWKPDQFLGKIS